MKAHAPFHFANIQVDRGNRHLLQKWISPFLFNMKLFTDADGGRPLVIDFNHRFQNCLFHVFPL